jgi:hypothetical protein
MNRGLRYVAGAALILTGMPSHAAGLNQAIGGVLPGVTGLVPVVLSAAGPLVDPVLSLAQPVLSAVLAPGIPLVMNGLVPVPVESLLANTLQSLPVLPGLPN